MIIKKFFSYLMFWKSPEEGSQKSFNLKMMHGINRLSILMFIIAMIFLLFRFVR